jgi:hypothetical protein
MNTNKLNLRFTYEPEEEQGELSREDIAARWTDEIIQHLEDLM